MEDTGWVFTTHAQLLALIYGAAVASFIVIFVAVVCRMTNEVLISRRCGGNMERQCGRCCCCRAAHVLRTFPAYIPFHYRVIRWVRGVTTLSLCFQIVLVAMELRLEELRDPVWPHYGLVVPVVGGIVTFVGYFVNSHPCFRWFVRV